MKQVLNKRPAKRPYLLKLLNEYYPVDVMPAGSTIARRKQLEECGIVLKYIEE